MVWCRSDGLLQVAVDARLAVGEMNESLNYRLFFAAKSRTFPREDRTNMEAFRCHETIRLIKKYRIGVS